MEPMEEGMPSYSKIIKQCRDCARIWLGRFSAFQEANWGKAKIEKDSRAHVLNDFVLRRCVEGSGTDAVEVLLYNGKIGTIRDEVEG